MGTTGDALRNVKVLKAYVHITFNEPACFVDKLRLEFAGRR